MANVRITDLTAGSRPKAGDLFEVAQNPAGTPISRKITMSQVASLYTDPPPDVPHAMDDEFDGTTLDPKWVWTSQGLAFYDFGGSMLRVICDTVGARSVRYLLQPIPVSANWRVSIKLSFMVPPTTTNNTAAGPDFTTFKFVGLVLRQVATTRDHAQLLNYDGKIRIYNQRYLGGAFQVTSHFFDGVPPLPWYWLRVEKNGANYNWFASMDGIFWYQYATDSVGSWLTADRVGLVFDAYTGPKFVTLFDYFRVEVLP